MEHRIGKEVGSFLFDLYHGRKLPLELSSLVVFLKSTLFWALAFIFQRLLPTLPSILNPQHWSYFNHSPLTWSSALPLQLVHFDLFHTPWTAAPLNSISFCWGHFVLSEGYKTIPKQPLVSPPISLAPILAEFTHLALMLYVWPWQTQSPQHLLNLQCPALLSTATSVSFLSLARSDVTHTQCPTKQWTQIKTSKWTSYTSFPDFGLEGVRKDWLHEEGWSGTDSKSSSREIFENLPISTRWLFYTFGVAECFSSLQTGSVLAPLFGMCLSWNSRYNNMFQIQIKFCQPHLSPTPSPSPHILLIILQWFCLNSGYNLIKPIKSYMIWILPVFTTLW